MNNFTKIQPLSEDGLDLIAGTVHAIRAETGARLHEGYGVSGLQGDDAELAALVVEYVQLEAELTALYCDGSTPIEDDAAREIAQRPSYDRQTEILARADELEASTEAGIIARAKLLAAVDPEILEDSGDLDCKSKIAGALVRDIIRKTSRAEGTASPLPLHDDAELISLASEITDLRNKMGAFFEGGGLPIEDDDIREIVLAPHRARIAEILDHALELEAKTAEGIVARAQLLAAGYPNFLERSGNNRPLEVMAGDLVRDILAQADSAVAASFGGDDVFSCFSLARRLPELWKRHDAIDVGTLDQDGDAIGLKRSKKAVESLAARIHAAENLILESRPATLPDAAAQLLHAFAVLDKGADARAIDQARRAIISSFFAVAAAGRVDIDALGFDTYAPFVGRPGGGG
jgi:hypothetical protein